MENFQSVQGSEASRFQDSRHLKVLSLSALLTSRLHQKEMFLVLISGRPGLESLCRRDFLFVQTGPDFQTTSCKMGTESFEGVNCGRGVTLNFSSLLCRCHGRVDLYICPSSGTYRVCNEVTLPVSLLIFGRSWVKPMVTVGTKVIFQWKNSNDTVGNRTRDLPGCSAVPQPNAPPSPLVKQRNFIKF